jgi:hypothetical protein
MDQLRAAMSCLLVLELLVAFVFILLSFLLQEMTNVGGILRCGSNGG